MSNARETLGGRWLAWGVHLYTAAGAVLAFLAMAAIVGENYRAAFLWLLVAVGVDATDGWLARLARVRERAPAVDGTKLDDIVDYLTFVFVPAFLIYRAGLLPAGAAWLVAAVMLLASAYGFSRVDAKTADHFFTGFPSYWNVVAFYLYAARLPPVANALLVVGLSGMIFVRVGYVYPSRTPVLRGLTVTLGIVWGVLILAMIVWLPRVWRPLLLASLVFPVYYTLLSFALHARRREKGDPAARVEPAGPK